MFYDHAAGVWVARVSLGVIDGKRVGRKASAKTELGARRALERLQRTYASGAPATETLDEYLGRWLQTLHKQRESTIAVYRHHVRDHIAPLLGGIPIAELRAADVERLIGNRLRARSKRGGRPLSPTTVARIVTTLRIALGRAKLRGELADNVAAQVELPRTPRREVPAMSTGQAEHILDAVRDHWTEPLSRLLLGSGLRLGEAVSLNQGDVYLEEAFVRLRTSKTTIRAVPVSPDGVAGLRQALIAAPRRGADEPLFFGPRTGRRLRGDSVSHALPRILTDAGLARLSPHGLRHGTATLMVAAGVPMRQVADQLGHRNPALTARVYAHVLPEALREAVKVLPNRREA